MPLDHGYGVAIGTFASFTRWPVNALRADQEPLLICLQGSATLRSQMPVARRGGSTISRAGRLRV